MREIKFRGMSISQKKWVYGDLMRGYDGKAYITIGVDYADDGARVNLEPTYWYEVYKETVGQYTGVWFNNKDGAKQEIYEGDIIHITPEWHGAEPHLVTVEYRSGGFMVEDDFGDYDITTIEWAIDDWDDSCADYELAGNIHEPKLLEVSTNANS